MNALFDTVSRSSFTTFIMSRSMTAAQVIALGEYLDPDFDPASLTVTQLLGVFGFHNVRYPTPYTKPKLIQLFNDEIKPKTNKFKKDRLKRENSLASDDGIKDGVTGKLIGGEKKPLRRSSRRGSRAPSADSEAAEAKPEPPKRRRSSAQPNLGGPSTRTGIPAEPVLVEESEPEEEVAVRKVSRGKKSSEDAGSRARRVSQAFAEDSGWEDNNIFQSGAESSSPARPSPVKSRARKGPASKGAVPKATRRSTRKATSAPPEMLPSSSPPRDFEDNAPISPPRAAKFEPRLPAPIFSTGRSVASPVRKKLFAPTEPVPSPLRSEEVKEVEENELPQDADVSGEGLIEVDSEESGAEEEIEESKEEIAISSRSVTLSRPTDTTPAPAGFPIFRLLVFTLFILPSLWFGFLPYKAESASIGYCDAGKNTNDVLEVLRTRHAAVEACNRENRTLLYAPPLPSESAAVNESVERENPACPTPSLIPHPDSCTPCPDHATCTIHNVECDNGYLLRLHPLLSLLPFPVTNSTSVSSEKLSGPVKAILTAVSVGLDGVPGVGSVALPPHCVMDPRRRRHIGVLGKAIESALGQERGRRLCAGNVPVVKDEDGGEAKRWGIEVAKLKERTKKSISPSNMNNYDDTFTDAMKQLTAWGSVFTSKDSEGREFIAHRTPDLDFACKVTVKTRELWQTWRLHIGAVVLAIAIIKYLQRRRANRQTESKRVAELVQVALDMLRNQELAHHTDPISAPHVYLSSL
ncbi:hypothetical protein EW146_g7396, partial [Bondarzewia mesenterica]